jgi:hypothetical protein
MRNADTMLFSGIRTFLTALLFICAVILYVPSNSGAQRVKSSNKAGEQRKAEKGLRDNRYFIYYINSTVTNYGTDDQKKAFREIIQRDIFSQFLYMKYMFYESFGEIRKCQKNLIVMYREFLKQDITMTKAQLDEFAPKIIASKDPLARLYLRLGYRETAVTAIEMRMADNYRTTLYSMRLYKYVKAAKRVKEAKKYAFLALIRINQTPLEKKENKPITFKVIDEKLSALVSPDELEKFKLMNVDAFYKTSVNKSIFDSVWEKPELESLDEFQKYLKTAE